MSATYIALWNEIFSKGNSGDFVASASFNALNHILAAHHKNPKDRLRYQYELVRPLPSQKPPRNFKLIIDITQPLAVNYEKDPGMFTPANNWSHLPGPFPVDGSGMAKEGETPKTNMRISIPEIVLQLKWPKLGGGPDHVWKPKGLSAELAAYVSIVREEGRVSLVLIPTMVNFSYAGAVMEMGAQMAASTGAQECEEKFNDLLLIVLNEFTVELLPKLVQTIELPSIDVASMTVHPTFLHISPMHVSVGAALDANQFLDNVVRDFESTLGALEYAIRKDVADAGGMEALMIDRDKSSNGDIVLRSQEDVDRDLPRANRILEELRGVVGANNTVVPRTDSVPVGVDEAFGIGFNEYLATTIADNALPPKQSKCTKDEKILNALKGKVCYWSSISDARINFSGSTIDASVDVDFGGKIVACVRKFWDCSWRWACDDYGLSFVGRPHVKVRLLSDSKGVRLACSVDMGTLKPHADLPWPFNKVVEFYFKIILKFVEAILNLAAMAMSFVVIPVRFTLPGQVTTVAFSKFAGFPYQAPSQQGSRAAFIGHSMAISAA